MVAIVFHLGFVRRHTYAPFVVYRLIVAALVLFIMPTGVRAASFWRRANPQVASTGFDSVERLRVG